ncbi:MAG: hypothetical protein HN665_02210 [Candidatus Marinimicrobia bacterium]|nr:hypothetical protein [Candidatus Neomarinimicrobiota bacterium]MBT7495233.1 hypothetical protein [Candidatus Neomarinimicrobiota bacterium]
MCIGDEQNDSVVHRAKEMESAAEIWCPYRTVAAWYLWKIVDGPFEW